MPLFINVKRSRIDINHVASQGNKNKRVAPTNGNEGSASAAEPNFFSAEKEKSQWEIPVSIGAAHIAPRRAENLITLQTNLILFKASVWSF